MNSLQKEAIKKQAREAAERRAGPDACTYLAGSEHERIWKDTFYANYPTPPLRIAT